MVLADGELQSVEVNGNLLVPDFDLYSIQRKISNTNPFS